MSASVIFPCTIKFRGRFFLALAHPGSPEKRAVKWLFVCVCVSMDAAMISDAGKMSRRAKKCFSECGSV